MDATNAELDKIYSKYKRAFDAISKKQEKELDYRAHENEKIRVASELRKALHKKVTE